MARDEDRTPAIRELFIEELAEVNGGNPLEKLALWQWLKDQLYNTTQACGEEESSNC